LNPTLSYTIVVGGGGTGAPNSGQTNGANGSVSSIASVDSADGGGGGAGQFNVGSTGGSGGGGAGEQGTAGGVATSGGNNGGAGAVSPRRGGGGGGAGAVGSSGASSGNGGSGAAYSISGASVTYAGGGGGGAESSTGGAGGSGGGGSTGGATAGNGGAGTANLGGGGAGANRASSASNFAGGNGGSGIVIISYPGAQQFGGGNVTSSGGNTIHTFTTSGTLVPATPLTAQYLVVAGGGASGTLSSFSSGLVGGGGGAGGLLTGTGVTIDTSSNYVVVVGAGGVGTNATGGNGGNSSWSMVSTAAVGGGGGGDTGGAGSAGGSGGGAGGHTALPAAAGGAGTSGQGYAGGASVTNNRYGGSGGGAGGAGVVANGSGTGLAAAGIGVASSISGTSVTYATGGSSGYSNNAGTAGTGNGGNSLNIGASQNGSNGGSGVVIISYPGSTQQMAGGTVTISGGNVIHTFTSSGYLTPIKLVGRSLRFRSSVNAYLNRTPATAGNTKTFTYSAWVKRGSLSSLQNLISSVQSGNSDSLRFTAADQLEYIWSDTSSGQVTTTQLFRDPSAWYHIVYAMDTTQATAANRFKLYVNGVQVTAFATSSYPAQNTIVNNTGAVATKLGQYANNSTQSFDGYLTEVNLIDGAALTPSSFGTFNSFGVWQPITYGGSYGTNGFYLTFGNNASTTTLGYDTSPQGNNWTTNNISVTAGVTYDSMLDVPTLTSATVANYCVANPLQNAATLSNGNLTINGVSASWTAVAGTIGVSSGKYYWELNIGTINNSGAYCAIGVAISSASLTQTYASPTTAWVYDGRGTKQGNGAGDAGASTVTYGATYVSGDVIGVALDMDAGTLTFYKNNTSQGVAFNTGLSGLTIFPWIGIYGSSANMAVNFGQRPFTYTPPSGFVALNTYNLSTPTIANGAAYMAASLYTGTGSALSVSNAVNGTSFQPDWVWIKGRNATYNHGLFDVNRGVRNVLSSNSTNAEILETAGTSMTAFDSGGFSLGTNGSSVSTNVNGSTFVAWQWKANGTGVSNTSGSITSTVSANTTAGFSIVLWTGNGLTAATVGHGLNAVPAMIICKERGGTDYWHVKHQSTASNTNLYLNVTNASTSAASVGDGILADLSSSTTFGFATAGSPGNVVAVNENGITNVAYCFAAVAGYSAFGSYTGNGSTDGPFVYLGFRPRFVLFKRTDSTDDWILFDTSRNTYDVMNSTLFPNGNYTETTDSNRMIDALSNGFKVRSSPVYINASGGTYIYAAFAENPFKYANAR
jgi:hypothetical protein